MDSAEPKRVFMAMPKAQLRRFIGPTQKQVWQEVCIVCLEQPTDAPVLSLFLPHHLTLFQPLAGYLSVFIFVCFVLFSRSSLLIHADSCMDSDLDQHMVVAAKVAPNQFFLVCRYQVQHRATFHWFLDHLC